MNWKKASLILGVIGSLIYLYPFFYGGTTQVHQMFTFDFEGANAFAASTKSRHDHEDLENKEVRLEHLKNMYVANPTDEKIREINRLKNAITALKKKLGYL